jgi:hypothetical protein
MLLRAIVLPLIRVLAATADPETANTSATIETTSEGVKRLPDSADMTLSL